MKYAMSDLHGCYQEYKEALEMIRFSDDDVLYVLGDVVDRGEGSLDILEDMMMRPNVIPLLGNHEYMMMQVISRFYVEITAENVETHLTEEDLWNVRLWMQNGGQTTLNAFRALPRERQDMIIEYLEEFQLYAEVQAGGQAYVLVHAGLDHFDVRRPLSDYDLSEMVFRSPDIEQVYFPDAFLVTGHTPTLIWDGADKGRIVAKNHHVFIDCGCVFGGNLGVYCLDTRQSFYVPKYTDSSSWQ